MGSVAFSPDGKMLASGSGNGEVRLWDATGTLLHTLVGHSALVTSVAFSPDSKMLLSGSHDGDIRLWSTDGSVLKRLSAHTDWVKSVAFSPNGRLMASASWGTVHIRKTTGILVKALEQSGNVGSVAFSSDGQVLASASDDQTIFLWSIDGTFIRVLDGHSGEVLSVAFSPDGKTLASASDDGTIRLWGVPPSNESSSEEGIFSKNGGKCALRNLTGFRAAQNY